MPPVKAAWCCQHVCGFRYADDMLPVGSIGSVRVLIVEGEPSAHRAAPALPYTARRLIGEYHGDDARCMDCGALISFGYCGSDDCPELACPVCLTGRSCCRCVGESPSRSPGARSSVVARGSS